MKRLLTICILALCCGNKFEAQDALCYRLSDAIERNIGQSYTINSVIPLDSSALINGFTISGYLTLQNRHSLARVILVDVVGNEHLLYEDRYWGNDALVQNFDNMAIETIYMEHIKPKYIKIAINHATLYIDRICYSVVSKDRQQEHAEILLTQRRARQNIYSMWKAEKWQNYNIDKSIPWIAGATQLSQLTYSEKKKKFGLKDDNFNLYGLEYYIGGYFVFPDTTQIEFVPRNRDTSPSQFTEYFDWRMRHGKNWMTSVKDQTEPWDSIYGNGGCWAFSTTATVESRVNLYYNQLLNLDLSEQELGSCTGGSLHSGGAPSDALIYIRDHGITPENCFPFENNDTVPCENKCSNPDQIVSLLNFHYIEKPLEGDKNDVGDDYNLLDSIKYELINYGPFISCVNNQYYDHAMCMCGYGTVQVGDSIHPMILNHKLKKYIIENDSPYLNQTYWIYKNSSGVNKYFNGYVYAVFESIEYLKKQLAPNYPIRTSALSDSDVAVTDADNDGYYFWGFGPKPSHCPVCCPDTPDGDDSDPTKGEMDNYGNFASYTFPYPTLTVTSDSTWSTNRTQCGSIIVTNNATLIITAELTMNPAAKITVQNGGTLIVNAGTIVNAAVDVQSSARLQLLNNGTLYLKQSGKLNVQIGAEADITHGRVLLQ